MIHLVAALPNFPSLFLRLAAWLCAIGATLALLVAVIRVISLLISFARDERHGKLALVFQAVGVPLGLTFLLGALSTGALFVEAQRYGLSMLGMIL